MSCVDRFNLLWLWRSVRFIHCSATKSACALCGIGITSCVATFLVGIFHLPLSRSYLASLEKASPIQTWPAGHLRSRELKVKMTYSQVWWLILGICALQFTHHKCTHPELWAVIYAAAPGEQLGVRCLTQGHLRRGIEVGWLCCTFTHPTYNSCRPETRTCNLLITSPTLSIRPRLPQDTCTNPSHISLLVI